MAKKSKRTKVFKYVSIDEILRCIENDEFKELDEIFESGKRDALFKRYDSLLFSKAASVEMVRYLFVLKNKLKISNCELSYIIHAPTLEIAREYIKQGCDPMQLSSPGRNNILHFGPKSHVIQAVMENISEQQQDRLLNGKNARGLVPIQCNISVRGKSLKQLLSYRTKEFYGDIKFQELIYAKDAKMLFDFGISKDSMTTLQGLPLLTGKRKKREDDGPADELM